MVQTRNTRPQKEVLHLLKERDGTLTADEILEALPIKVNKSTVYRILERFVKSGLLHFVTGQDGKAYYALCQNCDEEHEIHNHIHFQCENCGLVECLPHTLKLPQLPDYIVRETQFLMVGLCRNCST